MCADNVLVRSARIWQSGRADADWMLFSRGTGRVLRVGEGEPPPEVASSAGQVIHLGGRRVLPGLHESHIHVGLTGKAAQSISLKDCPAMEDLRSRIREYASNNPAKAWLTGGGWEQDKIGRYPDKLDIDDVCGGRPALLSRICEHLALANSAALEIAGITNTTPSPAGGDIDRFPADHPRAGEPTGILREQPAIDLVRRHIKASSDETLQWISTGLEACLRNGVTAVHTIEEDAWREYRALAEQGRLPIRVFYSAMYEMQRGADYPLPGECHGLLSCDRVKLFADGSLGGTTAALSLPYKGQHQCGLLLHTQEQLDDSVHDANASGYRLEIHVIGDRAAESAIEALEKAQVTPEKRPILTHCQLLREDLVDRMLKLGAIANIQPQFVTTDARWLPDLLPDHLLPWAYAWKSLIRKGVVCAGGSDSPVESPEPLLGIYDAIFRPNGERNADKQETFREEECLSVGEALELYTGSGAHTARREHDLGRLLPGYFADFVVFAGEDDPVTNPALFLDANIEQVWVAGERKL